MDQIFENIRTRRSVREFLDKRIAREDLETIVQAGAWAPTAMNKQTFQFTVLTDKEEIASLAAAVGAALGNPAYDFYRPAALVLVSNDKDAGTNPLADAACAMQNMFLEAHALGIGSVWMNQLRDTSDDPAVRAKLRAYGVPDAQIVWAVCALGYAAQKDISAPARCSVIRFVD